MMTFKLALRFLFRYRRKHFVSFMVICIGFAGLVLISGYRNRSEHYLTTAISFHNYKGHITVFPKGGLLKHLSEPDQYYISSDQQNDLNSRLMQIPGIDFVGHYLVRPGMVTNGCWSRPILATGIDESIDKKIATDPRVRKWTPQIYDKRLGNSLADFKDFPVVPVSTTPLLAQLSGKTAVGKMLPADAWKMPDCADPNVSNIIAADSEIQLLFSNSHGEAIIEDAAIVAHQDVGTYILDEFSLFLPLATLQNLLGSEAITYFAVFVKDGANTDIVFQGIKDLIEKSALKLDVYISTSKKANALYEGQILWVRTVEIFVMLILVFLMVFGTANFIGMSLFERKSEIGVFRSVGFNSKFLVKLFTTEIMLLNLLSIPVGATLVAVVVMVLERIRIPFHPIGSPDPTFVTAVPNLSEAALQAVGVFILNSVCAGIVTAWQVKQRNIANQSLAI